MHKLPLSENTVIGDWIIQDGKMLEDENCHRIDYLIKNLLKQIGSDGSGWSKLYFHAETLTYWELSFPKSELHGGGPPTLTKVERSAELDKRYNLK